MNINQAILIRAVIILVITLVLINLIDLTFRKPQKIHLKFLRSTLKVIVSIAGLVLFLNNFEEFQYFSETILTSSSLLVVVLGFAFQTSLSDVIAGLFLSIFRPFDINDRVVLKSSHISGKVEDISIRHTIIRTYTNSRLIIPNSIMNQEILENTHLIDAKSSHHMDVSVHYNTDLDKAKKIIKDCIESHPLTINPAGDKDKDYTKVFTREFQDSGIALRASVWTETVDQNFVACSDIRDEILKEFRRNDITIPYGHVNVILEN